MKLRIALSFGAAAALSTLLASPATALDAMDESRFVSPARGTTLTGGSLVEARWSHTAAAGDVDEAELVLSLDGGRTFPVRISAELSPRAESYRWRVPALASTSARLALRVGVDHENRGERLVAISDEFAIAADAPEPGTLARGAAEWWTEQALSERSVGELLETSLEGEGDRLVAPRDETDADRPGPSLNLDPPSVRPSSISPAHVVCRVRDERASLSSSASRPLRL